LSGDTETGIKLKLRKGDMELEIVVGKDVDEKQIKALQKLLQPFAEGLTQNSFTDNSLSGSRAHSDISLYSKLKYVISNVFKYGQWFTSIDAKEIFEDSFGAEIKIATVSTYLRRMEEEGYLISRKVGRVVEYKIADGQEEKLVATPDNYLFKQNS